MSDCPDGEYFSVTLQQCMQRDAYIVYLKALRDRFKQGDGVGAQLLKQEQVGLGDDSLFSGLVREGDPADYGLLTEPINALVGNLAKIIVFVIGAALVLLALNAWLNEQGTGVKVPVKLK